VYIVIFCFNKTVYILKLLKSLVFNLTIIINSEFPRAVGRSCAGP